MASIWLSFLLVLFTNVLIVKSLRCNDDMNGPFQLMEDCRACVIFIAPIEVTTMKTTTKNLVLPKLRKTSDDEPSIEELFLFDEHGRLRRRRRRYLNNDTIIRQQCARDLNGPLYGYDQTHCYCNSNQCNSNIQRCIYEVTSKRYFACYHGYNSSQNSLEIRHKCRSCRIRTEADSMSHYECLTFGEREQNSPNQCTCQRPMCNQDVSSCQRSQSASSQARNNLIITKSHFESDISETMGDQLTNIAKITSATSTITTSTTTTIIITTATTTTTTTATTTTTTTTTTTITVTTSTMVTMGAEADDLTTWARAFITSTISMLSSTLTITSLPISSTAFMDEPSIMTTETIAAVLSTAIELGSETNKMPENVTTTDAMTFPDNTTSFLESKPSKTDAIMVNNHGHRLATKFNYCFVLFQLLFALVIYSM